MDEIVIVDDGSTDNTAQVAESLAQANPCITYKALPMNVGAATARLAAVRLAQNEWIAPLDSDDYLDEGAVSTAFQQAQAVAADICLWTMYRVVDGTTIRWPDLEALTFPMAGWEAARLTLGSWRIHPLGVVRKEVFVRAAQSVCVESFNSDELVTRSLFLSSRVVTACSAGYYYVNNPRSTTKSHQDVADLVRSQMWLLQFADLNGFLSRDPTLAHSMVRDGLTLADDVRRGGSSEDLTPLLDLLMKVQPPLTQTGLRELYRTLRGRGSRQRIRELRRQNRSGFGTAAERYDRL